MPCTLRTDHCIIAVLRILRRNWGACLDGPSADEAPGDRAAAEHAGGEEVSVADRDLLAVLVVADAPCAAQVGGDGGAGWVAEIGRRTGLWLGSGAAGLWAIHE